MEQTDLFERLLSSLHEAALDDAHWPDASALIDRVCRSRGNILIYGHGTSQQETTISFARFCYRGERREAWERLYLRDYYPTDRLVPRVGKLDRGELTHLPSLYTPHELKTSRTYQEAHPILQTTDSLLALLSGPDGSRIFWANADPVGSSGWGFEQTGSIARLLPHVRQFVRVRQAMVDAQALGASMAALLENSRLGVIHLDWRGRIAEANDLALDLLRSGDVLSDEDGCLHAVLPAEDAPLQELLARATPTVYGAGASGSTVIDPFSALKRLLVHVVPLRHRDTDFLTRRVTTLVLLVGAGKRPTVDPALIAATLGLTPAESEVVARLVSGHTAAEIAAATGRKEATVRWHIKNIYAKTGITRQAELFQLLLPLANVPKVVR